MSGFNLFIVGVVVILALAFWNWRHTQENRQTLEQSGFNIDERFGGSPELVIDTRRQEFALISSQGYERYPLSGLVSAALNSDSRREDDVNFRIELHMQNKHVLEVHYPAEWDARRALERLQAYLAR